MFDFDLITRLDARIAGHRFYFTGNPCKRGHIALRRVCSRKCRECEIEEQQNAAYKERQKEHYRRNRKRYIAAALENHRNNRLARLAAMRERRENYTEEQKAIFRAQKYEWTKRNRQKINAKRAEANKNNTDAAKRLRASKRKWDKANPEACKAKCHAHRARKRNAEGRFDAADVERILKLQKGKCAVCRRPLRNDVSIDHIVPLSKDGTNWPNNIQLTHKRCNSEKSKLDQIEFMQRNGRLL